jgi:drug/metabolite transporter (DMT)-like permease
MTDGTARDHRLGLVLCALAALFWSTGGIFVRIITADLMTMLFWRGVFSGCAIFAVLLIIEGRATWSIFRKLRWPAIAVCALSAGSMISGVGALRFTTVAEALVIYATVPFVTAAVAWLTIGERPSPRTLLASLIALVGVAVMLKDASWDGSLFGKLLAFGMTLGMASMTTIMRRHPGVPMLPAMAGSAWLCSIATFWFASHLVVSTSDLALIAMFGIVQNAAGLILYAIGSKRVPAAEATLVAALEVPFTPLGVWLFLNETPTGAVLIGGLVVMAALFGHILTEMRPRRRLLPAADRPAA